MRRPAAVPWVLVALLLLPALAGAEEPIWKKHPNHLSVFVGGSDDDEETALTLGLDYEFRLDRWLGIGAVVEHAFEDIDAWTLLAVADIHIWKGLVVQTGPGVEFVREEAEEAEESDATEEEFTYRIGVLYEIEFDRFTFSPQLHYDITTGADSLVFGGAFGLNF